ncbi:hypothetical protein GF376_02955 [Candidatus Peregrinibacteria bacterium]|nr:hypothetical protein [Candidatus Peregrinibacteria bacterium]
MTFKQQIPNLISLVRIPLGILFFILFSFQNSIAILTGTIIIIISGLTDHLDGAIARKNKIFSSYGKIIDPFCDFIFFLFVFISFYLLNYIPLPIILIFLARETIMYSVIRPLTAKKNLNTAAKLPGKIKTVFQFFTTITSCLLIIFNSELSINLDLVTYITVLFSLSVTISFVSLYWYIKPILKNENRK